MKSHPFSPYKDAIWTLEIEFPKIEGQLMYPFRPPKVTIRSPLNRFLKKAYVVLSSLSLSLLLNICSTILFFHIHSKCTIHLIQLDDWWNPVRDVAFLVKSLYDTMRAWHKAEKVSSSMSLQLQFICLGAEIYMTPELDFLTP